MTADYGSPMAPATYDERIRDAFERVQGGFANIKRGGDTNISNAANDFRTAAEFLMFARIEACGLSSQDALLWQKAKDGGWFSPGKTAPGFKDCKCFLSDLGLVSEEELHNLEVIQLIGNKGSHAVRESFRPKIQDAEAAGAAANALCELACNQNTAMLRHDAVHARQRSWSAILINSLATDSLMEKIEKQENWAKQNPEKVREKDKEKLQGWINSLDYMRQISAEYYKKMRVEFPEETKKALQSAIYASIETKMSSFESKASFIKKKAEAIEKKQAYIQRKLNASRFDYKAYGELAQLKKQRYQAKCELDSIVRSLQDKFNELNNLVGAENSRQLRKEKGRRVAKEGYPPDVFSTISEKRPREKTEKNAKKATAGSTAQGSSREDETDQMIRGLVAIAVVVVGLPLVIWFLALLVNH